ncbi:MAG: DUF3536 domain-containing protein [Sphaerochaetaceae bacterium]|jgi:hypothetical protein
MKQDNGTKSALILHGHFYQPPRENPLVEIIPKQESAKPYHDWNEKIFDDCYRANAFSRYLDRYGLVRDIVNNYEYISFNFGPTLLNWLEKYHKATYDKILEADRHSVERLGYGNAIAQAYNHTILPLGTKDDVETQILWGLEDFEHRFKRKAHGMWLPETAVNTSVISQLVEAKVSFIILSPWQCKAVETDNGEFKEVDGNEIPFDQPFILQGDDGSEITAFFYHPDLASSISFGHMLRDADAMYDSLKVIKERKGVDLIHTATDGEIYGHHEPFGDMALAALIRKVNEGNSFYFTNYMAYLEEHPATKKAILHSGEDNKGSSWSCSHGVSRWYKDCGCHTGGEKGWNQKWRTPLRVAFEYLAEKIDRLFVEQIKLIYKNKVDPRILLNGYGKVISGMEDVSTYLEGFNTPPSDKPTVAKLLEGQRMKHYMFTSCGWFFSDLGGIEPRQNIFFATRAMQLYQHFTKESLEKEFLHLLSEAKSNRRSDGNGRTIANHYLQKVRGEVEAAAYFLMNQRFSRKEDIKSEYGKYLLKAFNQIDEMEFACEVEDSKTLKKDFITMDVLADILAGYTLRIESTDPLSDKLVVDTFTTEDIPSRMMDEVYSWIDHSLSRISDEELKHIATSIRHYSLISKKVNSRAKESMYIENMGTCLRALRSLFTTPDTLPWEAKKESISHLLGFIQRRGRTYEHEIVDKIFTDEISRVANLITTNGFNYEMGSYLYELLEVVAKQKIKASLTVAQEALYPYIKGTNRDNYKTPLTHTLIENLQRSLNFSPES